MSNNNLQIVQRLLELSKNPLEYSVYPKECRKEYIFLANVLNDSINRLEHEFNDVFKCAVGDYKRTLKENKKYGWFHKPEELVYIKMQINQLLYCVYGEKFIHEIKFNEKLGNKAYLDLINQIDRTVLMNHAQLKKHHAQCNAIAKKVLNKILKEEKKATE